MKQEAPLAAAVEPLKYNQMAPPMTAYTAEYALAKASAAMDGNRQQVCIPCAGQSLPFKMLEVGQNMRISMPLTRASCSCEQVPLNIHSAGLQSAVGCLVACLGMLLT